MKILQFSLWVALGLIGFSLNYLINSIEYWRSYLFYLRVPLIGGLLLVFFPLVAIKVKAIAAMFRNLFVMSRWYQVAMGIFAASIAGRSVVVISNAILENAPARFGIKELFTIPFPWDYLVGIMLGLPIILAIISETRIERKWWSQIDNQHQQKYDQELVKDRDLLLGVAVGAILSIAIFGLERAVFQFLNMLSPTFSCVFDLAEYISGGINYCLSLITDRRISLPTFIDAIGYIDPTTYLLRSSHLNSIAFSILAILLYIVVGCWFRPILNHQGKRRWQAPVLIYISSLFNSVVMGFGAITFYLDKSRFPVFLAFLLFSSASYWIWQVDHFFKLSPEQNDDHSFHSPNPFSTAIEHRLAAQGDLPRTLIVVTASGGGIHAAGWTTQVLTGLQELLGEEFTKAIGLISSVSGGSVGTMYFLDLCESNGCPKADNLGKIVKNAVQDGLNAVGWGLVYQDFWRLVGFPFVVNKNQDRGTALEINWQNSMTNPQVTLSDWRSRISNGEIPIPVFNTTLVEDGRRLLVSPLTFAESENEQKIDSNTLYQKDGQRYNLNAVTAARLSATFPYVSPSVRNLEIGINRNYHIIDGGYFDNSGVVTAIEWLDDHIDTFVNQLKIKRLLFIEIEAGEAKQLPPEVKGGSGWFMTIFGALQALLTVRDASLLLRNQQEIELLLKHYRSKLDRSESETNVQHFRIDFPRKSKSRFEIKDRNIVGKEYNQPLSWKLTASQKYALEEAWQDLANEKNKENLAGTVPNLKRLWKSWGFPIPQNN